MDLIDQSELFIKFFLDKELDSLISRGIEKEETRKREEYPRKTDQLLSQWMHAVNQNSNTSRRRKEFLTKSERRNRKLSPPIPPNHTFEGTVVKFTIQVA